MFLTTKFCKYRIINFCFIVICSWNRIFGEQIKTFHARNKRRLYDE